MEKQSKIGILQYIAKSDAKGCKFEDEPDTWYNPVDDKAKAMIKDEYKGKRVEIMLADGEQTKFKSMVVLESIPDGMIEVKQETIVQTPKEAEEPDPELLEEDEQIYHEYTEDEEDYILDCGPNTERYTKAVYKEMERTKLDTAKKGSMNLTYASWSEAWGALKRLHPTANFKVHENKEGLPYFCSELPSMGGFVKVTVVVLDVGHTVHLPIMDHSNKSIMKDKMTTFDVNKSIQRALAKAIALHGIGLYVFKGEDYPVDTKK